MQQTDARRRFLGNGDCPLAARPADRGNVMSQGAYEECAAACNACADACDHCLSACLLDADVGHLARCIALDLECAQICRLLAGYAVRGSKFASRLAQMCATVCAACADECALHDHDHCRRCADACRACLGACNRLAELGVEPTRPRSDVRA